MTASVDFDVLVVGAGPAGLSCGVALAAAHVSHLVIEAGSLDRGDDLITGVGGAGLYSDGKFSFFPSATRLWQLEPRLQLERAYDWVQRELEVEGVVTPELPDSEEATRQPTDIGELVKRYPSVRMSVPGRSRLINRLASLVNLRVNTTVLTAERDGDTGCWSVETSTGTIRCRSLVIGSGRLWHHLMTQASQVPLTFRRVELGVRIEQASDDFFLRHEPALDPKWTYRDDVDGPSFRTFCCCRDGNIVAGVLGGAVYMSGRSDCPPTGRSNVGMMVRYRDDSPVARRALERASSHTRPFAVPIAEVLDDPLRLADFYSPAVSRDISEGIRRLGEFYETNFAGATVIGPCVEGVGDYPSVDPVSLRSGVDGLYAVGDATGIFRGIVSALVSGAFVGESLAAESGALVGTRSSTT